MDFNWLYIGMLSVGLLAGVFSGLFGIGGGIVMVPTLVAFFGMELLNANAISLAAMLLPVGILGVFTYYKAGYIRWKDSLYISIGLLLGSAVGGVLAMRINISLLSVLYACFLFYIALDYSGLATRIFGKSDVNRVQQPQNPIWKYVLLGIFAGTIAGLFGKGGGIVIVPLLVKLFKYDAKSAAATSLAALQLPVGLPSVLIYAEEGYLNLPFAVFMAIGIIGGAFWGSKVAIKMPSRFFKRVYAIFLLFVGIFMLFH